MANSTILALLAFFENQEFFSKKIYFNIFFSKQINKLIFILEYND